MAYSALSNPRLLLAGIYHFLASPKSQARARITNEEYVGTICQIGMFFLPVYAIRFYRSGTKKDLLQLAPMNSYLISPEDCDDE